jgi:hypothetical protein
MPVGAKNYAHPEYYRRHVRCKLTNFASFQFPNYLIVFLRR